MRSNSSFGAIAPLYRLMAASLLLGLCHFFTGCATVVRGGSEKLIIQSTPSGAEVRLSTGQSGVTPYEVEVKRKDTIYVTITKSGYKELNTALISSIDGVSVGLGTAANFLTLPIINDIVDYKTGANYSHKPNPLVVTLIPLESSTNYQLTPPPAAPPATIPPLGSPPATTPASAAPPVVAPSTTPPATTPPTAAEPPNAEQK